MLRTDKILLWALIFSSILCVTGIVTRALVPDPCDNQLYGLRGYTCISHHPLLGFLSIGALMLMILFDLALGIRLIGRGKWFGWLLLTISILLVYLLTFLIINF